MSHLFYLNPDPEILKRCGFLTETQAKLLADELEVQNRIILDIDAIYNEQLRIAVETSFSELIRLNNLDKHHQTLLYVCLIESNVADMEYQAIYDTYKQRLRDKQLAQFLLLYKPTSKHKPTNIKVSTLTDTIKITAPDLIDWFGSLIQEFVEQRKFIPGTHGGSLFKFTMNNDWSLNDGKLNYEVIERLAAQTIRKPGIRDRNRLLATFLFKIWNVLDKATALTTNGEVRFSDKQLKFLFEVAVILGWIDRLYYDSDDKDYIYSLLSNEMKRNML
jgi:hypothetical protein